ncbi:alpha/beta hydrolase [Mangrovicella endophytica]|uniref:alpha/beta hydrolase n=1 Tax=Mangrovicella endophytica TaxID=2066697 RepID=UPI000C9E82F6|nr:alpha/beta fold hydrolase [Mangrovicella endophytica]
MRILNVLAAIVAFVAVMLAVAFIAAPREPLDRTMRFDPSAIGGDPDLYLARQEANVPNLRPEAAKEIVWAYPKSRAKTPLAIVYIHGFAASKGEMRPLADKVAAALGANLFYTRLEGHGRDGAALEQAFVNDWINDLAEAVAIGRAIGTNVIIIGSSMGATLSAYGATIPGVTDGTVGLVALSPALRLADWRSALLDLPEARKIVAWWQPQSAFQSSGATAEAVWTLRFPTAATVPLARLMRATREADLSQIRLPALFLYSPDDQLVDPAATRAFIERWPAAHEAEAITGSGDPSKHILAGDILSPATTDAVAERIVAWVKTLPAAGTP